MRLSSFKESGQYTYKPRFTGKNQPKNTPKSAGNPLKRIAPWVFSGMLLTGVSSCSEEKRYSDFEKFSGITTEYTDVTKQTRDSVMKPVYELQKKLSPDDNFLKGIKYDIVRSFSNMNAGDSFKKYVKENESDVSYKGTSFYSDRLLPKRIAVQECAFEDNNKIKAMRQTVMHETGHHFDNYYGHDHNADFAQKWDSIMYKHEINPESDLFTFRTVIEKDRQIEGYFYANNSLSDKTEFQNALYKDINNLKNKKELPKDIDYYLGNIDTKIGTTREELNRADGVRSEIYANLFSYLTGQDDGNKEKFLDCFSDSKKIVAKDMKKFLKFIK